MSGITKNYRAGNTEAGSTEIAPNGQNPRVEAKAQSKLAIARFVLQLMLAKLTAALEKLYRIALSKIKVKVYVCLMILVLEFGLMLADLASVQDDESQPVWLRVVTIVVHVIESEIL